MRSDPLPVFALTPSTSNSSSPDVNESHLFPTRTSLPKKRKAIDGDKRAQPVANPHQNPVDTAEVIEPPAKKRVRFQSQLEMFPSNSPLSPVTDTTEAPDETATDSPEEAIRSEPKRDSAEAEAVASSVTPQGTNRRGRPRTRRRQGRKRGN